MLELTHENTIGYLRERGWIGPGPASVESLGGGVSNAVLRVETPDRRFVLKQSRPQLRTRAAWFSDLERVYREQEVMQVLHPMLPAPTVPEILFSDRDNFVFAMSHAPLEARVWKDSLLAGEVNLEVGTQAGRMLGLMHEATARNRHLIEKFGDRTVFVQLRIEPFYRRIQQVWPKLAAPIEPLVERMLGAKDALCHGDYSPKNILNHDRGFTLVDYETAHLGDPSMDLGFFLSHLILKAVRKPALRRQFFDLTRAFLRSYGGAVRFQPFAELEARGIAHFAVCLLARIDGTSPVNYLPEEAKRDIVRRLGCQILQKRPVRWEDVLNLCEPEFAIMAESRGVP